MTSQCKRVIEGLENQDYLKTCYPASHSCEWQMVNCGSYQKTCIGLRMYVQTRQENKLDCSAILNVAGPFYTPKGFIKQGKPAEVAGM